MNSTRQVWPVRPAKRPWATPSRVGAEVRIHLTVLFQISPSLALTGAGGAGASSPEAARTEEDVEEGAEEDDGEAFSFDD